MAVFSQQDSLFFSQQDFFFFLDPGSMDMLLCPALVHLRFCSLVISLTSISESLHQLFLLAHIEFGILFTKETLLPSKGSYTMLSCWLTCDRKIPSPSIFMTLQFSCVCVCACVSLWLPALSSAWSASTFLEKVLYSIAFDIKTTI